MSIRELISRLSYLGRRSRFERDLETEIQFHIEARVTELMDSGIPRSDAIHQARREFGSFTIMREDSRLAWQIRWPTDLFADLRFALRTFRRSPGFTVTAVLSLALGIGANSVIFTAADTVLWKPLRVANPHELVTFSISGVYRQASDGAPSTFIRQLRESGLFADIIAQSSDGLSFSYDGRAERIIGEVVSPNFFDFLGVKPMLGEGFTARVRAGQWAPEAVLSYRFWKWRFGGDPGAIGRTIRLNNYPFTIVGVSPPSFFGLTKGVDSELRIPLLPDGKELSQIQLLGATRPQWLSPMARLKTGRSLPETEAAANAQLQKFRRTASLEQFRGPGRIQLRLLPGNAGWAGTVASFRTPLLMLLLLVATVLLITCANIAGMLLARANARQRELAVRISIGAGRGRLVRQMLTESVLLSVFGGALGIALAIWGGPLMARFLPQGHISIVMDLDPDARTLGLPSRCRYSPVSCSD